MNTTQELESFAPVSGANPKVILSVEELNALNVRSNRPGWLQLAGHLAVMGVSGYLWGTNRDHLSIALPALVVYGFSIASMFAPMHEFVHRTVFTHYRLNDLMAWLTGLLSFYNSTFYRRYHKWHHRYTRVPNKDPELTDLEPTNLRNYLLIISGLPWWIGKLQGHFSMAFGQFQDCPFIPEAAQKEITRSTRLQLAVYGIAIAVSLIFKQPWFFVYWLLPLAVGQPILRFILLAEHTECSRDNNFLTNTRTTLTGWPIRFLMWNMPYHAEHHLYPSIPFHALPLAHQKLSDRFTHVDGGYMKVNRNIITAMKRVAV
ncbi:fatty acid desaturase family protein [Gloeothece citriformis]|nr:fatty acid desaturase family protein [Gloeothece citriformis]